MSWELILGLTASFASVAVFAWVGLSVFARGWQSYEEKYVQDAERSLDAMYLTIPAQQILYLSFVCTVLVTLLVALAIGNLLFGLILGLLAFFVPGLTVHLLKRRRDRKFGVQLVDALAAMGNSLRAGFSLPMALELIAREMDNPMGQEMRVVVREMRLGVSLEQALTNLVERMPSEDLDLLITAITVSREVGGNLAEVFDNIAHTIRDRHRIEGKVRALTAQGRLQGFVVALLPVGIGIFLTIYNPEMMRPMFTTWQGGLLLTSIVILELLGIYTIHRLVSIKV